MKRDGRGFYALRHVFQTIGEQTEDHSTNSAMIRVIVDHIMGHAIDPGDMAATYREFLDDKYLRQVTEHVRRWLFPPEAGSHNQESKVSEEPAVSHAA